MGKFCPQLSGTDFDGALVKVPCQEHECAFYQQLQGENPQTGVPIDEWGCAITWNTILTIENSREQQRVRVAVEKLTNEVVPQNEKLLQLAEAEVIKVGYSND